MRRKETIRRRRKKRDKRLSTEMSTIHKKLSKEMKQRPSQAKLSFHIRIEWQDSMTN